MDWKNIVKSIAPVLGTALGSPMAGIAIKVLGDQFLGDPDADESDVAEYVMSANPEKLLEMKRIDAQFKTDMEKLGVDVFSLEVADRSNARENHKNSKTPAIILYILTILIALIVYGLMFHQIPEGNKNTIYMIVGQIVTAWTGSIYYWCGTTKGSSDKNKLLSKEFR